MPRRRGRTGVIRTAVDTPRAPSHLRAHTRGGGPADRLPLFVLGRQFGDDFTLNLVLKELLAIEAFQEEGLAPPVLAADIHVCADELERRGATGRTIEFLGVVLDGR
jgi:hypothetical protein